MAHYLLRVAKALFQSRPRDDSVIADKTTATTRINDGEDIHYSIPFEEVIVCVTVDKQGNLVGSCGIVLRGVYPPSDKR